MAEPKVVAIVLNWNGAHLLPDCLASLTRQDHRALEVVVADNGSTDGSEKIAAEHGVGFLALGVNLGFSAGNNAAARQVGGDFLLFVNNDMRFEPDFVSRLVGAAREDPDVFACDATQLSWDGSRPVHRGIRLRRTLSPNAFLPFLALEQTGMVGEVPWGNGANLLVRRQVFHELGGFHDALRFDLEDLDLCWRAWLRGYRTVYVPDAIAYHRVGASFRDPAVARIRQASQARNEIVVAARLFPAWTVAAVVGRSVARLAWQLLRLRWLAARSRARGIGEGLGMLTEAIRDRRSIAATAVTSSPALIRRFVRSP